MSIFINREKCVGCRKCTEICPGNLIYFDGEKAFIKYPKDCWSCASCLKECSREAIELSIPKETGGFGGFITLKKVGDIIEWKINLKDRVVKYETNRKESNKY